MSLGSYISSYIFGNTRFEIIENNFLAKQTQLLQELLLSVIGTASIIKSKTILLCFIESIFQFLTCERSTSSWEILTLPSSSCFKKQKRTV